MPIYSLVYESQLISVAGLFSRVRRLTRPTDRWNRKSQIIPKLGRILKFKPQQCYKLIKILLQTENEGKLGFELWPRFADFARFFCAFALKTPNLPWLNTMSLLWLSFVTIQVGLALFFYLLLICCETLIILSKFDMYVLKFPLLYDFNPKCFDWHYTVYLVLRSLILSVISIKWLALAIRSAFFFIVFSFFLLSLLILFTPTNTQKT